MSSAVTPFAADWFQTDPGLSVLRLAALCAETDGTPDEETLDSMFEPVEAGELSFTAPSTMWPELVRGLMAPSPATMMRVLRECGALRAN